LVRQPKTAVFLRKSPKPPRRQGVKSFTERTMKQEKREQMNCVWQKEELKRTRARGTVQRHNKLINKSCGC